MVKNEAVLSTTKCRPEPIDSAAEGLHYGNQPGMSVFHGSNEFMNGTRGREVSL
jgi:hypothetical protein